MNQCRHASEGVRNVSEEPNASVIILLYFWNQPLIDASIINSAFFLSYRLYYFSNSNCTIGSSSQTFWLLQVKTILLRILCMENVLVKYVHWFKFPSQIPWQCVFTWHGFIILLFPWHQYYIIIYISYHVAQCLVYDVVSSTFIYSVFNCLYHRSSFRIAGELIAALLERR